MPSLLRRALQYLASVSVPWSPLTVEQKIQAIDKAITDRFGYSIAISEDGNTLIVGAKEEDAGGSNAGAAYIFTLSGSTWTQQQKIMASDKQSNDAFGWSVSISDDGNTAIVGCPFEDTGGSGTGAAYVFTRSGETWTEQEKIQSDDIESGDNFGQSVAMSSDGDTVIVGAHFEDTGGGDAGAAYVFTRAGSTWTQQQKIQSDDVASNDNFGWSVTISGDGNTVIAGQRAGTGAAYVFTRSDSTWTQQQKIQSDDIAGGDQFGTSVAISSDGNTAIVGAYHDGTGGLESGAAYVFTRSVETWTQQQKLLASDKAAGYWFGSSVSMSSDGNNAIVGSNRNGTGGQYIGAAYIFTRSGPTWTEQLIQAGDKVAWDEFGYSVDISLASNTVVVGAKEKSTATGAAYIFMSGGA